MPLFGRFFEKRNCSVNLKRRNNNIGRVTSLVRDNNYGRVVDDDREREVMTENTTQEAESIREMPFSRKAAINEQKEMLVHLTDKVDDLHHFLEENRVLVENKIHSESVKEYRNIQALIDELGVKVAKAERLERQVDSMKNYLQCTMWFTVITLVVLVAFILFQLGVF